MKHNDPKRLEESQLRAEKAKNANIPKPYLSGSNPKPVNKVKVQTSNTPSAKPEKVPSKKLENKPQAKSTPNSKAKPKKKKKIFHIYVAVLFVWLIALTCVICWFYGKANDYITHYEDVYQSSMPNLVADDIFENFKNYDVDFIWNNMAESPRISKFETEDTVKEYIHKMIDGKEMTYKPSNKYSDAIPSYVVEADGFVVAEFSLCKDLQNPKEFGFPTWQLKTLSYYTEPFETVYITAPINFNVYVNDILLDETYVCSEEIKPSDESYVIDYGTMPGIHDFYAADLYSEPTVKITDIFGQEVPVEYNETTDIYSTGYTDQHPEREALEEFAISYTTTFANVISHDDKLENLKPFFPENSQTYDYISRNSALKYFMSHSNTTIENEEIKQFIVYSEDVVFIEVYIEQHMTTGWEEVTVVETTSRLYCVKLDGEWKVVSMRF